MLDRKVYNGTVNQYGIVYRGIYAIRNRTTVPIPLKLTLNIEDTIGRFNNAEV